MCASAHALPQSSEVETSCGCGRDSSTAQRPACRMERLAEVRIARFCGALRNKSRPFTEYKGYIMNQNNFESVKNEIFGLKSKILELQEILTSIPAMAPESGGNGESEKCAALKKFLLNEGFKESQFSEFDCPDSRVSSGVRPNLILTVEGKNTQQSVWVMAHLDVVPPGDLSKWNGNPWKVRFDENSGKITGRGVEDNQQGLVSGVTALLALVKKNVTPSCNVKLLFMADEEFGSEYGIKFLLKEHKEIFGQNDLIIIPDGGDSKGETIEVAEKNILWLKVHVTGEQTHGSMPHKGKNAFLAGCALAVLLNDMENFFDRKDSLFSPPYSTFQPTKKESNVETVNIIPGDDVFYVDCRILPCYTLDTVRNEIKSRVRQIEEKFGVKVDLEEVQAQQSPATSVNSPVVEKLSKALLETHGIKARPVGIGGGTVGAELRNYGFDAAIWSTMDEVCHQPEEYCFIQNIIKDAQTLAWVFMS